MEEKFSWFQILFYSSLGIVLVFATATIRETRHYPYLLFILIGCFFAERVLGLLFHFVRKTLVDEHGAINTDMAYNTIFDFLKIAAMLAVVVIILALLIFWRRTESFLTGVLITVLAVVTGALLTLKSGWVDKKHKTGGGH